MHPARLRRFIPLLCAAAWLAGIQACTRRETGSSPDGSAAQRSGASDSGGFRTTQPAQARPLVPGAEVRAILSTGDPLPGLEGEPDPEYRVWAPAPDGLGAYRDQISGRLVLHASHEIGKNGIGGAFSYSRISRLEIDPGSLRVLAASYPVRGSLRLERLCSATWADSTVGFPSGYFLTGEETVNSAQGGITIAVSATGSTLALPWLGRYRHENQVPVPGFGQVVVVGLDDSPGASELYLYTAASERDLLVGRGKLHVFVSDQASHAGNLEVGREIRGRFLEIANPAQSGPALQAAADDLGAFPFARLEDGDYDRRPDRSGSQPTFYFADTGGEGIEGRRAGRVEATCDGDCDRYGSIYRMRFDPTDPTRNVRLVLLARSRGVAAGDWASPDNIAVGGRSLIMQEDPAYGAFDRAPQIWQFVLDDQGDLTTGRAVVELNDPDCSGADDNCWSSSGIIDASAWLGAGIWLFDVQAPKLPGPGLGLPRGGGQLLALTLKGS